jgi:hypothetical protein
MARVVFHRQADLEVTDLETSVRALGRAVGCLSHVIALAEVRNLPLRLVDALLVHAEIMGCCAAAMQSTPTPQQQIASRIIPAAVAREVWIKHMHDKRCHPITDLARAGRLIEDTGYRKRVVEWTVLKRVTAATPCAYLLT